MEMTTEQLIAKVELIESQKDLEQVPWLNDLLVTTNDHAVRHVIALALADLGNKDSLRCLIQTITSESTKGYRGPLVYASMYFDCSEYLLVFVELMVTGGYEPAAISQNVIEEMKGPFGRSELRTSIDSLLGGLGQRPAVAKDNSMLLLQTSMYLIRSSFYEETTALPDLNDSSSKMARVEAGIRTSSEQEIDSLLAEMSTRDFDGVPNISLDDLYAKLK